MKYRLLSVLSVLAAATLLMTACGEKECPSSKAFSIGNGHYVEFSPGNLRYRADSNIYTFSIHQYDIVGMANQNIDPLYEGWIDLFGWGTGSNGCLAASSDTAYTDFVDWGSNMIDVSDTNFHNMYSGTGWRTLTYAEWDYLISQRPNAAALRGTGKVHNVSGLILLPDKWVADTGFAFRGAMSGYSDNEFFSVEAKGDSIWQAWESRGAIFLPACGQREGTRVTGSQQFGRYWSSTPTFYGNAYFMGFMNASEATAQNRFIGRSVRLVKDVQ